MLYNVSIPAGGRLAAVNRFYGSFVSGMQNEIAEVVRERLGDGSIIRLLDGAVIFETELSYDKLNFFCFNNVFAVIDILENGADPLELHLRKICSARENPLPEKALSVISENNKKIKSFRLVFSVENKPAEADEKIRLNIEKFIAENSPLKLDRTSPDTEFWFLQRREGFSCFMKRLTRRSPGSQTRPGELSPQLAWLLCRIAGLKHGETVIDPFCGCGSIPNAAVKHFPIKKFYASDIDSRCIKTARLHPALKKTNRCEIFETDFRSVPDHVPAGTADAVVSDPPWGLFRETDVPLQTFYNGIIDVFWKLLAAGGRAVILSAAAKELETAAAENGNFMMRRTIPILVSGKKAAVFVLEKRVQNPPAFL